MITKNGIKTCKTEMESKHEDHHDKRDSEMDGNGKTKVNADIDSNSPGKVFILNTLIIFKFTSISP